MKIVSLLALLSIFCVSSVAFAADTPVPKDSKVPNANAAIQTKKESKTANTSSTTQTGKDTMNNDANKKFLEENKKKAGVVTLPSGLQYKVQKEGKGSPPGPSDFVSVYYRGTLIDGTEFDSSLTKPVSFAVNAVIPGWTEALQHMTPGSKWTVYIPSELGYGGQRIGNKIPPHSTLVFDIELLSVKPSLDENRDGNVDEWEDKD